MVGEERRQPCDEQHRQTRRSAIRGRWRDAQDFSVCRNRVRVASAAAGVCGARVHATAQQLLIVQHDSQPDAAGPGMQCVGLDESITGALHDSKPTLSASAWQDAARGEAAGRAIKRAAGDSRICS